jgi:hypothetical protein
MGLRRSRFRNDVSVQAIGVVLRLTPLEPQGE